ncbi:MAG: helix-turn-helix domain-containing protein, partial [Firmicutes bacterium]|nr:helix-turn-helix domain-containing protein [Bacillota bacterium]
MKFKEAIYKRITEIANGSGLTLSQLAIKSGMTPSTLYQIKTNDTNLPSLLSVKRICDGLNITLSTFFDV